MHVHVALKESVCAFLKEAVDFQRQLDARRMHGEDLEFGYRDPDTMDCDNRAKPGLLGKLEQEEKAQQDEWDCVDGAYHRPLMLLCSRIAACNFDTTSELHGSRPWIAADRRRKAAKDRELRRQEEVKLQKIESLDAKAKRIYTEYKIALQQQVKRQQAAEAAKRNRATKASTFESVGAQTRAARRIQAMARRRASRWVGQLPHFVALSPSEPHFQEARALCLRTFASWELGNLLLIRSEPSGGGNESSPRVALSTVEALTNAVNKAEAFGVPDIDPRLSVQAKALRLVLLEKESLAQLSQALEVLRQNPRDLDAARLLDSAYYTHINTRKDAATLASTPGPLVRPENPNYIFPSMYGRYREVFFSNSNSAKSSCALRAEADATLAALKAYNAAHVHLQLAMRECDGTDILGDDISQFEAVLARHTKNGMTSSCVIPSDGADSDSLHEDETAVPKKGIAENQTQSPQADNGIEPTAKSAEHQRSPQDNDSVEAGYVRAAKATENQAGCSAISSGANDTENDNISGAVRQQTQLNQGNDDNVETGMEQAVNLSTCQEEQIASYNNSIEAGYVREAVFAAKQSSSSAAKENAEHSSMSVSESTDRSKVQSDTINESPSKGTRSNELVQLYEPPANGSAKSKAWLYRGPIAEREASEWAQRALLSRQLGVGLYDKRAEGVSSERWRYRGYLAEAEARRESSINFSSRIAAEIGLLGEDSEIVVECRQHLAKLQQLRSAAINVVDALHAAQSVSPELRDSVNVAELQNAVNAAEICGLDSTIKFVVDAKDFIDETIRLRAVAENLVDEVNKLSAQLGRSRIGKIGAAMSEALEHNLHPHSPALELAKKCLDKVKLEVEGVEWLRPAATQDLATRDYEGILKTICKATDHYGVREINDAMKVARSIEATLKLDHDDQMEVDKLTHERQEHEQALSEVSSSDSVICRLFFCLHSFVFASDWIANSRG